MRLGAALIPIKCGILGVAQNQRFNNQGLRCWRWLGLYRYCGHEAYSNIIVCLIELHRIKQNFPRGAIVDGRAVKASSKHQFSVRTDINASDGSRNL